MIEHDLTSHKEDAAKQMPREDEPPLHPLPVGRVLYPPPVDTEYSSKACAADVVEVQRTHGVAGQER